MACSSGCPTQDHASFGECLRSKKLQIADPTAYAFHQHRNSEVKEYVRAREAGLQPKTFFKKDVDAAWKKTEATGIPYRADQ